jgi:uroporphyrinogen-III synthase
MISKVLITRPRSQSNSFAEKLRFAGFVPIFFPVIEIRAIDNNPPLDKALQRLNCYEWVVFTSVNAVDVVLDKMPLAKESLQKKETKSVFSVVKVAAIGPKTAEALLAHGVMPDFVPDKYVAESILEGLGDLRGKWVLLPRAEIARKALPEAIVNAGGTAHEITVYKTLPVQPDPEDLARLKSGVDWITFTSPSTVQNFVQVINQQNMNPFHLMGNPKVACIGPITERAAREEGFKVDLVAEKYTTEGLIKALRNA